uniref:CCHC-type domain-containing protein n=1 Tax=Octopus bimaculoides TaxID=37653 RepID=A0A0L8H761_OCTBM
MKISRITEVNCSEYGLKVLVHISLSDLHKIAEELILPDEARLKIVVEGRPPVCFLCGVKGHMRAKCPQKHEEEETGKESQEEERATVEEEKMDEQYTMAKRKKTDSPPKSPRKKRKASGEEKQSEKQESTNEKRKNEKTTKVSEERTQRPSTSKAERIQKSKENEKEMIATQNERQTETEMPVAEEGIGEGRRRVTPKERNLRTMVQYPKSEEMEKRIAKMKNVIRVKVAAKEYNEGLKAVLLEKERREKPKELFGKRIEMTGIHIGYDELTPVVAFEELIEYML